MRIRWFGLLLAVLSVVLPALPLGPLFAQPPLPLAVMWAAYGWASEPTPGWGAPVTLAVLGLVHDHFAFAPYGFFAALYLATFILGRVATGVTSAPSLFSIWGGFIATCLVVTILAAIIGPMAFGARQQIWSFAEAAAITALVFPLVRGLYMSDAQGARG